MKTANSTLEKLNEQLESAETDEEKTAIQAQITEVNKNIQVLQATITGIESELKNQGITDIKATIQAIESGIEKANSELSDGGKANKGSRTTIKRCRSRVTKSKKFYILSVKSSRRGITASRKRIKRW